MQGQPLAALSAISVLALLTGSCAGSVGLPASRHLGRALLQSASGVQASASDDSRSDVPNCLTPWAVFNSSGDLSFFAQALHAVGLNEAVDSPYVTATFFAPTNAAFAALLHSFGVTQDQLLADPSIVPILLYHMIPGQYIQVGDMNVGDALDTAISENLTVGAATAPPRAVPVANNTVVTIRSAQSIADIIAYNITACMAVIHEVDQVLVPEFKGVTTTNNRITYGLGDGSGSRDVSANFTLILPAVNANVSDILEPVYQITEAGLMFSVSPSPI